MIIRFLSEGVGGEGESAYVVRCVMVLLVVEAVVVRESVLLSDGGRSTGTIVASLSVAPVCVCQSYMKEQNDEPILFLFRIAI